MNEWMDEERERVPNLFGDFVGGVQVQLPHSSSLSKAPPPPPQAPRYGVPMLWVEGARPCGLAPPGWVRFGG